MNSRVLLKKILVHKLGAHLNGCLLKDIEVGSVERTPMDFSFDM